MRHWTLLGEADIPESNQQLQLYRGKDDYFIKLVPGGGELMNTRKHASEDALATLPCKKINDRDQASMLVGGLGMGFTLAAALKSLGPGAMITVAELIPEVVTWNRGELGRVTGYPLNDPRVSVVSGDVADLLSEHQAQWDIIALDVDNGPEGLTQDNNDALYTTQGILQAVNALKPRGVLAYWSAGPDPQFQRRLKACGLQVEEVHVYAHGHKGARHTIWLAQIK